METSQSELQVVWGSMRNGDDATADIDLSESPGGERGVELEGAVVELCRSVFEGRLSAKRIRIPGDYHLGQVLWSGKDLVFIDFEGDSLVALEARQLAGRLHLRFVPTQIGCVAQ